MELVYLWVEKYKNIYHQGFNFNPRFEFEYIQEKQELVLKKENKEYVSIFPQNINITGMVGKNGAGKSTIQKLIFLLIFLKKYENFEADNPIDAKKEEAIIELFKNQFLKNKNIFLIINTDTGFKKISLLQSINNYANLRINQYKSNTRDCPLKDQYDELESSQLDFFSIHFNYMIDTWFDDKEDQWVKTIYHRTDGYSTPILLEPYKGYEDQYIDIDNIEYLYNQKTFTFYNEIKNNKHITNFFNPNNLFLMIDGEKIKKKYQQIFIDDTAHEYEKGCDGFIDKLLREKDVCTINRLYLLLKIMTVRNKNIFIDQKIKTSIESFIFGMEGCDTEKIHDEIKKFDFSNLLAETGTNETEKIEIALDFIQKLENDVDRLKEYKQFLALDPSDPVVYPIDNVYNIFNKLPPWIYAEFYDNDISYTSLSGGQKMFFSFIINLLYQIQKISNNVEQKYQTINLFLDEVEFGLHPDWQKRFLNEVLFSIEHFNIKINFIIATHSPFLLSDLPKENVLFLEKGKQVYPNIDTFGANIHTLLSHGFFMKNGLMGEFAKERINTAISYLNKKTLTENQIDFCENIISIIGEPILKRQLQKMLDSKRLSKVDKIEKQIKELQEELKKIKK